MSLSQIAKGLKRKSNCHKGDFGHALIIGGDLGMGGSVIMAAESACKVGAGKVSVLTHNYHASALLCRAPNAMYLDINQDKIFHDKNVIAIGMGLGKSDWSQKLFAKALDSKLPKIIDADALNLLAQNDEKFDLSNAILTPHAGEAGRLLGVNADEISKNRKNAAKKLHEKYGAIIVLKGHRTLIFDGKKFSKCLHGNPGMATAGMGDALSGVIAGLVAQKLSLKNAAILGVNIHAMAGDMVAKKQGKIGMTPMDLIAFLPKIISKF